jgi:hypothetical protein
MTTTACDDQFAKEPDPPKTVAVCARTHTSDQVLTGNYLQLDAELLEKECRLARERGKVVCVWVILTDDRVRTTCEKESFFCNEDIWCWFNYCPICGKKIKVKT